MHDAVIFSDFHLGSSSCRADLLLDFLHKIPSSRRVILLGDVLDRLDPNLSDDHWDVLIKLQDIARNCQSIWVKGNHDSGAEKVAKLIGVHEFTKEYSFSSAGRRMLCVHGHQWDNFETNHPYVTWLADNVYWWLQLASRRLAARVKRDSMNFVRNAEPVKREAVKYARRINADTVVCGHVHHPEHDDSRTPQYLNCGCWTDHVGHYVLVKDGRVTLNEYPMALRIVSDAS